MPSNIPDLVIPEGREVRTTPSASSDEDDFHPSSAQKQASESDVEEERTVGLKPFNTKSRGMRQAKAPSEHDGSSEQDDDSQQDSADENDSMESESAGPSRKSVPDLETDDNSSNDDFLDAAATKRQRLQITQGPDAPEQLVVSKKKSLKVKDHGILFTVSRSAMNQISAVSFSNLLDEILWLLEPQNLQVFCLCQFCFCRILFYTMY